MHGWIEAIEAEAVNNRRGSRKSVSVRNRSPSIQSPKTKIRKGSAGESLKLIERSLIHSLNGISEEMGL